MRLHVIVPSLEPALARRPSVCPRCGTESESLGRHQRVAKPISEGRIVPVQRYHCANCGRTFRAYPQSVGHAPTSQRIRDVAVVLYLLGLSYGGVATSLEALGLYISKTRVYAAVKAALGEDPDCRRCELFTQVRAAEQNGHEVRVRCNGRWLCLQVTADDAAGLVLTADGLTAEAADMLEDLPERVAQMTCVRLMLTEAGVG